MADREKLKAVVEDWSYKDKEKCVSDSLVDHLIANGVTVQKWIPASEPPEKLGKYNVMIKGAKKSTALWYYPNRKTWEDELYSTPYPVTHWMPLPEPPKEGE